MKYQAIFITMLLVLGFQFSHAQRSNRGNDYDRNNQYDDYYNQSDRNRVYCPPSNRTVRATQTRNYDPNPSGRRIQYANQLFYRYDKNGDGRLRFNEFNSLRINGRKIQNARREFRYFDQNGNNSISKREFLKGFRSNNW